MKVEVFIPVYHPDEKLLSTLKMLKQQKGVTFTVHVVDSSEMGTAYRTALNGIPHATYSQIPTSSFNHGGTRQQCIDKYIDSDAFVFLTQDAIPADEYAIANITKAFDHPEVGCSYGRQLPHKDANVFSRFARLYNYGSESYIRSYEDRKKYGIKTVFSSDSFAAYRKTAITQAGGFPRLDMSEDMYMAAKMLMQGWKIAYQAQACVYHSHNLSISDELARYKKIGVFNRQNAWIRENFGAAEKSGVDYVKNEMKYILKEAPLMLPVALLRDMIKYVVYKMQ